MVVFRFGSVEAPLKSSPAHMWVTCSVTSLPTHSLGVWSTSSWRTLPVWLKSGWTSGETFSLRWTQVPSICHPQTDTSNLRQFPVPQSTFFSHLFLLTHLSYPLPWQLSDDPTVTLLLPDRTTRHKGHRTVLLLLTLLLQGCNDDVVPMPLSC